MSTTEDTLFQNGAVWLRADFHLHTKADREFSYTEEDKFYYINLCISKATPGKSWI